MRCAMAEAVAGTALVAGGAAVLNQVYERDTDALMRRTRPASAAGRPRRAVGRARLFGAALSSPASPCSRRARTCLAAALALATLVIYLVDLHADEAPHAARDARRRRAWRAAAAHRLDGGARIVSTPAARRCSPSCSSGRSRTSWRSRGCTATITATAGFPMLPVIEPDGRRAGDRRSSTRPRCCRSV